MANDQSDESGSQEETQQSQPDVATVINQAITAHMKRYEKTIAKQIEAAVAPYKTKLEAIEAQRAEEVAPTKGKKGDQENPELVAMRQKMDDLTAKFNQATERATELERRRKEDIAYNEVRNHLSGKVKPEALNYCADWLFKASGKIEYDEDGTPLFKSRMAPAPGLAEEDVLVPLQDGIDQFLKSKDAAIFVPAPAATGSAPRAPASVRPQKKSNAGGPPTYEHPATTDEERIRRAQEKSEWIKSKQSQ